MSTITVHPNAHSLGSGSPSPTLTGAANDHAAMDSNTASYLSWASNPSGYKEYFQFPDPGLPAGATLLGVTILIQDSTSSDALSSFYATEFNCTDDVGAFTQRLVYMNIAYAATAGSPETFNSPVITSTQKTSGGAPVTVPLDQLALSAAQVAVKATRFAGTIRMYELALVYSYNEPPTVASVQPSDYVAGETFTSRPTIEWVYDDNDDDPQQAYQVVIVNGDSPDASGVAPGDPGYDPLTAQPKLIRVGLELKPIEPGIVWNSGKVFSSAESADFPSGESQATLKSTLAGYYAYVRVWQPNLNGIEVRSDWEASPNFITNVTPPASPTIAARAENAFARMHVEFKTGGWGAPVTAEGLVERSDDGGGQYNAVRFGNFTKATGFYFDGTAANYLSTPDIGVDLDFSADFIIFAEIMAADWTPAAAQTIISKWGAAGQRSYAMLLDTDGKLRLEWSNNGTTQNNLKSSVAVGTSLGLTDNQDRIWVAAGLLPDDGAGNKIAYFFTSTDGVTWSDLGTPNTNAGTTTIFSSTAEVEIGARNGGADDRFSGHIYNASLHNSILNQDYVAALIQDSWDLGSSTWTEPKGHVWTKHSTTGHLAQVVILNDYELPNDTDVKYRATAIAASNNASDPVEGSFVQMDIPGGVWWLKVPENPELNMIVDLEPDALDADRDKDAAAFSAIGRTRSVVVTDVTRGRSGTLKVQLASAALMEAFELIYDSNFVTFIQSAFPRFGDGRYFALLSYRDKLEGAVGDYYEAECKYEETDAP